MALRLAVVLLLALAVPLQAVAAVTAGVCMVLGHGDAHAHHDEEAHHSPDGKNNHCPPCVACCAAAAIAYFVPHTAVDQRVESVASAVIVSLPALAPHCLDRPPKSILA